MANNITLNQLAEFTRYLTEIRSLFAADSREASVLDKTVNELTQTMRKAASGGSSPALMSQLGKFKSAVETGKTTRTSVTGTDLKATADLNSIITASTIKRNEALSKQAILLRETSQPMALMIPNLEKEAKLTADILAATAGINYQRSQASIRNTPLGTPISNDTIGNVPEEFSAEQIKRYKAEMERALKYRGLSSDLPGGETTFGKVSSKATKMGFGEGDVSSIAKDMGSNSTVIKYFQEADGYIRKMTVTVDQFGTVTSTANRRLQGFGESLARDTLEFIKWSLAITLVLGPLQEINKLAQEAVQQQDKLVDTTIALGDSQKSLNTIYDNAYKISQQVSEETGNVVEAFTLAYRATGGVTAETERFAVASKLLVDSLTLSKLAGIDESTAIDTLSAGLKQLGYSLEEGNKLLDIWVKATKIANIDLDSLASAFTTAGDLSQAAGISVEQLTGIIAALGEVSESSGDELASITKSVISGFQSDNAKKTLQSYGIAIDDLSGKARNFTDVMDQLSALKQSGVLNSTQYSEITLALGGGTRRQGVWSALIENWQRVGQVSTGVQNAEGSAADALAKKQETAASAVTRMANAFSNLAVTLGTKGGLLDTFTNILDVTTFLVDKFDALVGVIGKVSPMLIAISALTAFSKVSSKSGAAYGEVMSGKATGFLSSALYPISGMFSGNVPTNVPYVGSKEGYQRQTWSDTAAYSLMGGKGGFNTSPLAAMLAGAITTGTIVSNLTDSGLNKYQKQDKVVADIAGGIGGAIASALTGANPMIGVAIGTAISEAFVNATTARTEDFSNFFKKVSVSDTTTPATAADSEKQIEYQRQAEKAFGGGSAFVGSAKALILSSLINATSDLLPNSNLNKVFGGQVNMSQNQLLMANLKATNNPLYNQMNQYQEQQNPTTSFENNQTLVDIEKNINDKYGTFFTQLTTSMKNELLGKLISGQITHADYTTELAAAGKYNTTVAGTYGTIGQAYQTKTGENAQKTIEDFAKVFTYSTSDEQDAVAGLVQQIVEYKDKLSTLTVGSSDYNSTQDLMNKAIADTVTLMLQLNGAIAAQIELRGTVDLTNVNASSQKQILDLAETMQHQAFLATGGKESDYSAYKNSMKSLTPEYAGGYGMPTTGLSSTYIAKAKDQLIQEGKIPEISTSGVGIQSISATPSQLQRALTGYEPLLKQLEAVGYKSTAESAIVTLSDGTMTTMTKDWKIVQMLLSQILDVDTKQLETSTYNFPSGMSAYVPFGAVNQGLSAQGSIGYNNITIPGTMPSPAVEQVTQATIDALAAQQTQVSVEPTIKESLDRYDRMNNAQNYSDRYDTMNSGTKSPTGIQNLLETLNNTFMNIFGTKIGSLNTQLPVTTDNAKSVNTKLSLNLRTDTEVHLDTAVIARAVSKYQADKLVSMNNSGSTSVRLNAI